MDIKNIKTGNFSGLSGIQKEKSSGKKVKKIPPVIIKITLVVFVVLLIACGTYYFMERSGYFKTMKMVRQLQQQQQASSDDQKILSQLKKIISLPEDITPTMAIVQDAEALKKAQPVFFNNVKNGDHLIIYPDLAIIYDYEANRIMKVGPVQIAMPAKNSDNSAQPAAPENNPENKE